MQNCIFRKKGGVGMQSMLIELALPEDASQKQKDAADWLCGVIRVLDRTLLPNGSWMISGEGEGVALEYVIAPKEEWIDEADVRDAGVHAVLRHRIGELVGQHVHDLKQRFYIPIVVLLTYPKVCRRSVQKDVAIVDDTPRRRKPQKTKRRAPRRRFGKKEEEE